MNRQSVSSSNIKSVGWEADILEVEFRSKAVYQYSDVPEHVYRSFVGAHSLGRFFHYYIRDKYKHELVNQKEKSNGQSETETTDSHQTLADA